MNNETQSTGFSVHNVKPSQVTAQVTVFKTFATLTIKYGSGEIVLFTEHAVHAFGIAEIIGNYEVTTAQDLDNEGNAW